MCPDQSQAFKEVNNSQAFTVGRRKKWPIFFLEEPLPGAPRHVCTSFPQKSKNWLRRTSIKSNLKPEIENTLKRRNYDAKPLFLHFTAQKPKCPRRFWEIDPEILHTCSMCPCRAFYEWGFRFLFFSLEMWHHSRPKYSKKYKNPNTVSGGKKKKKKKINSW